MQPGVHRDLEVIWVSAESVLEPSAKSKLNWDILVLL